MCELFKGIFCCNLYLIVNYSTLTARIQAARYSAFLFCDKNCLSLKECEKIKREFVYYNTQINYDKIYKYTCCETQCMGPDSCTDYKKSKRLDTFRMSILNSNDSSLDIRKFFKLFLLVSHGNRSIEKGFSVNRKMVIENHKKSSLIALRQVNDEIVPKGCMTKVSIMSKMNNRVQYSREIIWMH